MHQLLFEYDCMTHAAARHGKQAIRIRLLRA
jgi:hypothetical protein